MPLAAPTTSMRNEKESKRYLARLHRLSTHALTAISAALLNSRNDTRICIASEGCLSHSQSESIACHWKEKSICWIRWSSLQHHSLHCRLQFGTKDYIDVFKFQMPRGWCQCGGVACQRGHWWCVASLAFNHFKPFTACHPFHPFDPFTSQPNTSNLPGLGPLSLSFKFTSGQITLHLKLCRVSA